MYPEMTPGGSKGQVPTARSQVLWLATYIRLFLATFEYPVLSLSPSLPFLHNLLLIVPSGVSERLGESQEWSRESFPMFLHDDDR